MSKNWVLDRTPDGKNAGVMIARQPSTHVQDVVSGINCTDNAGWQLDTGLDGYGYVDYNSPHEYMFSSHVGPAISNINPRFVDSTRNLATWGQRTQGTDGTVATALAALAANPALIYDAANPNALWQWVRAGFAPRNSALRNAAHDNVAPTNGTIGAVEFKSTTSIIGSNHGHGIIGG